MVNVSFGYVPAGYGVSSAESASFMKKTSLPWIEAGGLGPTN